VDQTFNQFIGKCIGSLHLHCVVIQPSFARATCPFLPQIKYIRKPSKNKGLSLIGNSNETHN
jgi:hypothetical protein